MIQLLQLPVPPPSYFADTGNVPLAAGTLAVSFVQEFGKSFENQVQVLDTNLTDSLGDHDLVETILKNDPKFVGLSLYLWNSERSLYLANELKKKNPNLVILIGGPEVNPDNPFLLNHPGFDVAVNGEAEDRFGKIIKAIFENSNFSETQNANSLPDFSFLKQFPGVSFRESNQQMSAFAAEAKIDFPLSQYPSPYLEGYLLPDPQKATYVESVRGCKSQCTYCFYPKSSNTLRTLNATETVAMLDAIFERGAREFVFLDPTFNHRPGFEEFLDSLVTWRKSHSSEPIHFFAELRPEGINPKIAKKLALAGFNKIEIGLQSVNRETLRRVKRYGDPEKVAEVSKMLKEEGIDLLLDLIIGLPGDSPKDVLDGVDFFLDHGLEDYVQVFPLSVLPGTSMRKTTKEEGLLYHPYPPYRIIRTNEFSEDAIVETLLEAESELGRRIDEVPRPFLVDPKSISGKETSKNILEITKETLDYYCNPKVSLAGNRHRSVRFSLEKPENFQKEILYILEKLFRTDPHSTYDICFYCDGWIPKDFLEKVQIFLNSTSESYLGRVLSHRGENQQKRIQQILSKNVSIDFLSKMDHAQILFYFEREISEIRKEHSRFAKFREEFELEAYFLCTNSSLDAFDFQWLKDTLDPEEIVFSDFTLEKKWNQEVLGYANG